MCVSFLFTKEPGFNYRWPEIYQQQYAKHLLLYASGVACLFFFLFILTSMSSVNPVNTWHHLYKIGLIGYLALCFIPYTEKTGAQLKCKLALIMLSNELHFCSINLISPPCNPINMHKQGSS